MTTKWERYKNLDLEKNSEEVWKKSSGYENQIYNEITITITI